MIYIVVTDIQKGKYIAFEIDGWAKEDFRERWNEIAARFKDVEDAALEFQKQYRVVRREDLVINVSDVGKKVHVLL